MCISTDLQSDSIPSKSKGGTTDPNTGCFIFSKNRMCKEQLQNPTKSQITFHTLSIVEHTIGFFQLFTTTSLPVPETDVPIPAMPSIFSIGT